jgi:DNA-binding LacI/PurR family transcriptional regulator
VNRPLAKPKKRVDLRLRIEKRIRDQELWGQRLVSERELAAQMGVCRRTLQGVLAELEADGVVERRHGSGTYVCERPRASGARRTARVAVIAAEHCELTEGWHYRGEMIRGLLGQAPRMRAECTVFGLDRPDDAASVRDAREMRSFDAFVSVQVDDRELLSRLLALRRGPVVLLDHFCRDLPIVTVVDGSFEGARAVTRYLGGLGHRRIAFLDCHNRAEINPEKFAGYRAGLADRGLDFDEELLCVPAGPVGGAQREGYASEAVQRLLELAAPPTAIFGFDDNFALPAMTALEARGLRVGRDISVAGFGDSAVRRGLCDRLTSCRIYPRKMGREALRAALGASGSAAGEGRTVIVPDRLRVRESTCPPRPSAEEE